MADLMQQRQQQSRQRLRQRQLQRPLLQQLQTRWRRQRRPQRKRMRRSRGRRWQRRWLRQLHCRTRRQPQLQTQLMQSSLQLMQMLWLLQQEKPFSQSLEVNNAHIGQFWLPVYDLVSDLLSWFCFIILVLMASAVHVLQLVLPPVHVILIGGTCG